MLKEIHWPSRSLDLGHLHWPKVSQSIDNSKPKFASVCTSKTYPNLAAIYSMGYIQFALKSLMTEKSLMRMAPTENSFPPLSRRKN